MKREWPLRIPPTALLLFAAGCANGPVGPNPANDRGPRLTAPVLAGRPAVTTPAAPKPPAPVPSPAALTAEDIAYLRWLIQVDAVVGQIVAQEARDLPPPTREPERLRVRAMLQSWEDSRPAVASANTHASMAAGFAERLRAAQAQFRNQPAPPNCRTIAAEYGRVLAGLSGSTQFHARLYRYIAQLMQNPRAASQMVPPDLQDGGIAEDARLRAEVETAKASANAALADLFQRFPGPLPGDIAAFRLR
jgi:hypothetical protein